jgi:hypothetical protein
MTIKTYISLKMLASVKNFNDRLLYPSQLATGQGEPNKSSLNPPPPSKKNINQK